MDKFIIKPDISLHTGIKVTKETKETFKYEDLNGSVKQTLSDLVLKTELYEIGDKYESTTELKINLNEGDILLFDETRGYLLPGIPVCTIQEVIDDYEVLKGV